MFQKRVWRLAAVFTAAILVGGVSFAIALQGSNFPIGSDPSLKVDVGWDATSNGGLIFKGENGVAPTFAVHNTRDGGGPRQPVFETAGRDEQRKVDSTVALNVFKNVESKGSATLELAPQNNLSFTLIATNKGNLLLRKKYKEGNWIAYRFYQLNHESLEVNPENLGEDLEVGADQDYEAYNPKRRCRSCLDDPPSGT
ncbi:MAG: hypothetical protein ACLFRG_10160 [Desulfococcaceae bacterium]